MRTVRFRPARSTPIGSHLTPTTSAVNWRQSPKTPPGPPEEDGLEGLALLGGRPLVTVHGDPPVAIVKLRAGCIHR